MSYILGISAYYHDSAAAIIKDGEIVAAVQEERFSRKKHDPAFPARAIQYCLKEAGCSLAELDCVVFYDKPLLKFERLLETFLVRAPRGFSTFLKAMPVWLKEKLYLKQVLRRELLALQPGLRREQLPPLNFTEHHQSHAASAYFPSPFTHAAVVCLDGVGEWATSSVWEGKGSKLKLLKELQFPHSLGLLYSAFTYYCGFRVNSGEYKLMGLAPYGTPRYTDTILQNLVTVKDDGSFALNLDYFDFETGHAMTSARFHQLFDGPPWPQDKAPDQRCMDLAASIQQVTEHIVENIARHARQLTGARHLCLAGGVALNCVANGKLRQSGLFDDIWIQPAAGDAGGALGAALSAWYIRQPDAVKPSVDSMQGAQLGPAYTEDEMRAACKHWDLTPHFIETAELHRRVADLLLADKVVGWFQGRAEYGPRALGNRSILGNPQSSQMQRTMNVKIKQRESFRPFAPAVLRGSLKDYFDAEPGNPYMLEVARVQPHLILPDNTDLQGLARVNAVRSSIPAVTHIDYSARVQVVDKATSAGFHALIEAFADAGGVPLVINTSFNVRGEPPVCSPDDAIRCFLATDMDYLVLGSLIIDKSAATEAAIARAKTITFEKD
ncbi:carbamoyltransferase [Alteromonas sp. ASW11-19]|uniref:Carbamoyltransferase n=1 Tax=Alteromonas salexigens TaxID=2982530 RepID=A0ABT2VLQ3_9ALTE|nr:carbamoyltransferase [Alteromonas salexigens]MCU7554251.1 carbamoyltransferase [Alteromonas salexigens]